MSASVLMLLAALPVGLIVKPLCLWIRVRYLRDEAANGRDALIAARALALAEGRDKQPEPPSAPQA